MMQTLGYLTQINNAFFEEFGITVNTTQCTDKHAIVQILSLLIASPIL